VVAISGSRQLKAADQAAASGFPEIGIIAAIVGISRAMLFSKVGRGLRPNPA
jgi:hypothetical protein